MTNSNFQDMSRTELRSYLRKHREDDVAFYTYIDKIYEAEKAAQSAVFEWLKVQYPNQEIIKNPKTYFQLIIINNNGEKTGVEVKLMLSSLPTYKPFLEDIIRKPVKEKQIGISNFMIIFVSKDENSAFTLGKELIEVGFNNYTKLPSVVGYLKSNTKFEKIESMTNSL